MSLCSNMYKFACLQVKIIIARKKSFFHGIYFIKPNMTWIEWEKKSSNVSNDRSNKCCCWYLNIRRISWHRILNAIATPLWVNKVLNISTDSNDYSSGWIKKVKINIILWFNERSLPDTHWKTNRTPVYVKCFCFKFQHSIQFSYTCTQITLQNKRNKTNDICLCALVVSSPCPVSN